MASGRLAAGGGRWLEVPPERLARWLAGFAERHGAPLEIERRPEMVRFAAPDGAVAECHVPFPPLAADAPHDLDARGDLDDRGDPGGLGDRGDLGAIEALTAHAAADRLVGVLLVRLGGYAVGVFEGERLLASKVGSRLVHGRSAAGGWSQHRFARRRDKQAREALAAAATTAAAVLGPYAGRLDAVVLGGDRRAVDRLRADPRLAPLFALAVDRFLTVPDPRPAVLMDAPRHFRAVRIRLVDPG